MPTVIMRSPAVSVKSGSGLGCTWPARITATTEIYTLYLLGAPQLVAHLAEEQRDLPGIRTGRLTIASGSPYDGRTLGDTALRSRAGVSVVAVMRAGQVHPSPLPDFTLTAGDLMITVGTSEGLDRAFKILKHG